MTKVTPHCQHGHPLTHENVYTAPKTGERRCRQCQRIQHSRSVRRRGPVPVTPEVQARRDANSQRAAQLVSIPEPFRPLDTMPPTGHAKPVSRRAPWTLPPLKGA